MEVGGRVGKAPTVVGEAWEATVAAVANQGRVVEAVTAKAKV